MTNYQTALEKCWERQAKAAFRASVARGACVLAMTVALVGVLVSFVWP